MTLVTTTPKPRLRLVIDPEQVPAGISEGDLRQMLQEAEIVIGQIDPLGVSLGEVKLMVATEMRPAVAKQY